MTDLKKDIMIVLLMIIGIWAFISGLFITSTLLFGSAAILSNIDSRNRMNTST